MQKVLHIGTIKVPAGSRQINADVFIKVRFEDERLSISGVIGPKSNGNAWGGCGQIDMEFKHRNDADDDKRYGDLIKPVDISFTADWGTAMWYELLDVWKRYHLNDMHAECKHQRALGWKYETHQGQSCPTCGYEIGTEWKSESVPESVIKFLQGLPETKKTPAWV